jgi:CRP-like cAMP-binding protein
MRAARRNPRLQPFLDNRLFAGIDSAVLKRIAPRIGVLRVQPGEVIFREGEPGNLLYLVGEGSVKISQPGDMGEPETVDYIDSGNFFGATALLRVSRVRQRRPQLCRP